MVTFKAVLSEATLEVPSELIGALGSAAKRPPVRVTVNGVELRTTIMVYGGQSYIGLRREAREKMGVASGDTLEVALELDTEQRSVDVPPELERIFADDAHARSAYEALSLTNKREYVEWLTSAKRAETRQDRLTRVARAPEERSPLARCALKRNALSTSLVFLSDGGADQCFCDVC